MKLRKLFIILLTLLVVLSFAGCGGGGNSYDDPADDTNYLCFTSTGNSSIKIRTRDGGPASLPTLEYSKDKITWKDFVIGDTTVELADGKKVYLRGDNTSFSDDHGYLNFEMTGSVAASGNVMSLLDKTCKSVKIPNNYCFGLLFYECTVLTAAPELPATTLAEGCYSEMFDECTSLTSAPELPATTLKNYCYSGMFAKCTNLTAAPELPATTLTESCYMGMFYECENLTTAPELPATTLAESCYSEMFYKCENLTAAPELPATTLADYCYSSMFMFCSKLNSIKVNFTTWNTSSTMFWVYGIADTGTFTCPSSLVHDPLIDGDFGDSKVPLTKDYRWNVVTF